MLIADDQELVRTGFLGGGGLRRAEEARARPVDPTVVRSLVGDSARASRLDALSGRERQVLALAAEGHTNARIAAELGYSERTAETHMRSVFQKLDLLDDGRTHRRVLAVLAFLTTT